ncbi:hypothetical protein N9H75_04290 [Amylibacter sp.]|nr:hypothetical protein [Amylibacter sp.]
MMPKQTYDYIFLIEHEDRERACVERICEKLEMNGKRCCVLSLEFHLYLLSNIQTECLVIPYGFEKYQWPINYLFKMFPNVSFYSLNWEQLLTPINQEYKKPRDSFFKEEVIHIAWSEEFKTFLLESGVKEKNVFVTGNVHYELLAEECSNNHIIKKQLSNLFGIDGDRKWVFLPMNYAWAFISDSEIRGKIRKGYNSINAWIYKDYAKKCILSFLNFLNNLSLKYDDHIFVVRPHPSISCEQYIQIAKKKNIKFNHNVFFSKDLTIREWIIASEIVGSSWSSSVWDAVNVGKKGFLYTPYKKPDWHNVWWEKYIVNFKDFADVDFDLLKIETTKETKLDEESASLKIATVLLARNKKDFSTLNTNIDKFSIYDLFIFKLKVVRTYLRYICMIYLRGTFIKNGLRRDFFKAKL